MWCDATEVRALGRHKIKIDQTHFESLCALHCTLEEIANFFGCSADTIERWAKRTYNRNFAEIYAQKREVGRLSLRRKQYEIANKGNVTMLIWLGKQWLHQTEKVETKSNEPQGPINYVVQFANDPNSNSNN